MTIRSKERLIEIAEYSDPQIAALGWGTSVLPVSMRRLNRLRLVLPFVGKIEETLFKFGGLQRLRKGASAICGFSEFSRANVRIHGSCSFSA